MSMPLSHRTTTFLALVLSLASCRRASAQEPPVAGIDAVSLFDGRSLAGWTEHGGRYDGAARWTVEDGAIVGRQGPGRAGGLLYTTIPYTNVIVTLETRVDEPFDSGLFLRMAPRGKGAQVTLDARPGGEIGAIYSDGFLKHNPDGWRHWKKNEWNRLTVRCVGHPMHLTAWLNGHPLVDHVIDPKTVDAYAPTGLIGIQVHGGAKTPKDQAVRFRHLRLIELPGFDDQLFAVDDRGILTPTEAGRAQGWRSLFNGRDLTGWDPRPDPASYRIEDGLLLFPKQGGGGELRTIETFRDFDLRLDFKIAFMANSGVFLRANPRGGNPAFSGCEIQILDDFNWERQTGTHLKPWQFTGSLYGAVPNSHRAAVRPLDRWNTYEIRYRGSRLMTALNGTTLYDIDTLMLTVKPPFADRAPEGFIGLQRHAPAAVRSDIYCRFRNIFIRPRPAMRRKE